MSAETIRVAVNVIEILDEHSPAIPQLRLARAVIDLINRDLLQHNIVIDMQGRPNAPTEGGEL